MKEVLPLALLHRGRALALGTATVLLPLRGRRLGAQVRAKVSSTWEPLAPAAVSQSRLT